MKKKEFIDRLKSNGEANFFGPVKSAAVIEAINKAENISDFIEDLEERGFDNFEIGFALASTRARQIHSRNNRTQARIIALFSTIVIILIIATYLALSTGCSV